MMVPDWKDSAAPEDGPGLGDQPLSHASEPETPADSSLYYNILLSNCFRPFYRAHRRTVASNCASRRGGCCTVNEASSSSYFSTHHSFFGFRPALSTTATIATASVAVIAAHNTTNTAVEHASTVQSTPDSTTLSYLGCSCYPTAISLTRFFRVSCNFLN